MTVHMPSQGANEAETVSAVLAEAAGRFFGRPVTIENLSRESGGASRQTWSFDAVAGGTHHGLILRRDPPLKDNSGLRRAEAASAAQAGGERSSSLDRAPEVRVLLAAHRAGVRAPEPLFELSAADGLGEAYVMRRVAGTAIARKLLRDPPYEEARRRIAGQLGEILVRIHATDTATLPALAIRQAADQIATLRRSLDLLGSPQPVFELARSWLDRRKPAPVAQPVLVHGDYRTGNYLADESGVTSILDWEGAHLGDPTEDLGWVCVKSWRFGAVDKPAGGFGSREELWSSYERAGGQKVDPARAHWWEVLGTARWGIICHTQAWRHLSGAVKSMELASIGRRAVETEVDLLQLLKDGG